MSTASADQKTGAAGAFPRRRFASPVWRLRAGADLDGLHRGLGLGLGLINDAVGADDGRFGRDRLLVNDRAFLRLHILHDVLGGHSLRECAKRKSQRRGNSGNSHKTRQHDDSSPNVKQHLVPQGSIRTSRTRITFRTEHEFAIRMMFAPPLPAPFVPASCALPPTIVLPPISPIAIPSVVCTRRNGAQSRNEYGGSTEKKSRSAHGSLPCGVCNCQRTRRYRRIFRGAKNISGARPLTPLALIEHGTMSSDSSVLRTGA
jgi:hypothetical protein